MIADSRTRTLLLAATLLTFSACGGGGSDDGGGGTPTNSAPTANAGAAQTVDEFDTVTLNGSGTDPNGDALTFSWTQMSGTNVTLSDATVAAPTFDAPDVMAVNTPEVLRFRLTVSDGSLSSSATVDITVNDAGLGLNSPPTAAAGADQNVPESTVVDLDGTGSFDPDGDALTYSWTQTGGQNVTLNGADTAQPSFTAPDVAAGSPQTLTFELTVDDGTDSATDSVDIVVAESATSVTVAGKLQYEFVPPNFNCAGLNFNAIQTRPVRAVGTTTTDDNGDYSFSNVAVNTDVRIRVRAELKQAGAPGWDVEVRDNVDTSASPPALSLRPLYVVQWDVFNTGIGDVLDADYTATTGWDGSS